MDSSGWYPGGAAAVVPGKTGPWRALGPGEQRKGPKMTTNQRANAAIEQYWLRRVPEANSPLARPHTAGSSCGQGEQRQEKFRPGALPGRVPGGEKEIAARVKKEGRNATIALGNHDGFYVPSWPATPRDLSEKEDYERRGIPGFTGANPAPHQKAPGWPVPEDPSSTFAINACDARRPWTSGVRGYTGHQLPGTFVGRSERTRGLSPGTPQFTTPEPHVSTASPSHCQARNYQSPSPDGPYAAPPDIWRAPQQQQYNAASPAPAMPRQAEAAADQQGNNVHWNDMNAGHHHQHGHGGPSAAMQHRTCDMSGPQRDSVPPEHVHHNRDTYPVDQQQLSDALHGVQLAQDTGHGRQTPLQSDGRSPANQYRQAWQQSQKRGNYGCNSPPIADEGTEQRPWRPSTSVQPALHTTAGAGGYPSSVANPQDQRSQSMARDMARDMAIQTTESMRHAGPMDMYSANKLAEDERRYGVTFRAGVLPKPILD